MQSIAHRPLSIGISFRDDLSIDQLVYCNGISQNIKFLYDLLELMGHQPFLLLFCNESQHDSCINGKQYRSLTYDEVIERNHHVDVALEIAVTINPEFRDGLRETFGCKIVHVKYGNSMFMDMELLVFRHMENEGLYYANQPDGLWISPHFEKARSYYETMFDCPAEFCPYIWEPDFVEGQFEGDRWPDAPNIYVMEPNVNVLKTSLIPMTIIERVFRRDPDLFDRAYIVNGQDFSNYSYFLNNIARNMPSLSCQHEKVFFSSRCTFDEAFTQPAVLLAHQWECSLNYLYMEALYKGVALVHNSPDYQSVGYYYPEFDAKAGEQQCIEALKNHKPGAQRKQYDEFLFNYSIHNPAVQQQYQRMLDDLVGS